MLFFVPTFATGKQLASFILQNIINRLNFRIMEVNNKCSVSAGEQTRRLSNRWVFDCANRLIADEGMERKCAFGQAVKAFHLLEQLGKGEVRFEYLKANGERRKARGTLCHGISPAFDNYEFKNDKPDEGQTDFGIITYWDLDREAFRSLHIKNLMSIDV